MNHPQIRIWTLHLLVIAVTALACSDNNPSQPIPETLSISVKEAFFDYIWLEIRDPGWDDESGAEYLLLKDGIEIARGPLYSSVMYRDEGLAHSTSYTYKAYKVINDSLRSATATITASTVTPADPNVQYTFTSTYIGQRGSVLHGAAVSTWGIQYIYGSFIIEDEQQPGKTRISNAAWRDVVGDWNYLQVPFKGTHGNPDEIEYEAISAVMPFRANEAWFFTATGRITHLLDGKWTHYPEYSLGFGPRAADGYPEDNFYVVGQEGAAHWNGSSFRQLPIRIHYTDIFRQGISFVLALGQDISGKNYLYSFSSQGETLLSTEGLSGVQSLWTASRLPKYFAGKSGIHIIGDQSFMEKRPPQDFVPTVIRGTHWFKIYAGGAHGGFYYFNGFDWISIDYPLKSQSIEVRSIIVSGGQQSMFGYDSAEKRAVVVEWKYSPGS